jgi:hypothetical protein
MLHACAARFDVTENLEKVFGFWGELNKALVQTQSCRFPQANSTSQENNWQGKEKIAKKQRITSRQKIQVQAPTWLTRKKINQRPKQNTLAATHLDGRGGSGVEDKESRWGPKQKQVYTWKLTPRSEAKEQDTTQVTHQNQSTQKHLHLIFFHTTTTQIILQNSA